MSFCLPKELSNKFIESLKRGDIQPEKLAEMTSAERHKFFEKIVGPDNAGDVNALFESKLLLKDYKRGLVSWAKKVAGINEPVRRDLIAKIEKLDRVFNPADEKAFLADLARQKLGATVSLDEARTISEYAKTTEEFRAKWDKVSSDAALKQNPFSKEAGWSSYEDKMAYGYNLIDYRAYLNKLLGKETPKFLDALRKQPIRTVGGVTKGILASFDDSFFGRQGRKLLATDPVKWTTELIQSWKNGARQIAGHDMMRTIEADIVSSPNAMNGKYKAIGVDLGIDFEEALPSHQPEKIPILGRLYKASEVMFNGSALRLRAAIADRLIASAERVGINTLDPKEAKGLGILANEMTGRGHLGKYSVVGNDINVLAFSVRFLKANIDALTLHQLNMKYIESPATRTFVRKQAAVNLLKVVGQTAAIMTIANMVAPGSAETDTQSSNFGKIKIGATTIDITGGMGSIVTLASRLVPTLHDGKWGFWSKSSQTGKWTDLTAGKYGQQTAMDVFDNFLLGKLSPLAGLVRDVWKGKNFNNQPVTPTNAASNLLTPLPVQTVQDLMSNPKSAPVLAAMILDGLGFSTYTPPKKK